MAGQELCGSPELTVKVNMLGPFAISLGGRVAGPWPRPSARRLCEFVLLSPGQRVSRELAAEELFGSLGPQRAATALRKALSMARGVLAQLGEPAVGLLQADRDNIWFRSEAMEIDLDRQERALRAALAMGPGQGRDDRLVAALSEERAVLADAPYVEWALRCRDRFEVLRQRARLTLARDRSKGAGRSNTAAVLEAWESCLGHDPACEEAAAALMRVYTARGARPEAVKTYERCQTALAELGLSTSPALDEVRALAAFKLGPGGNGQPLAAEVTARSRQARKTISVLFAEITGLGARTDPEDLRDAVARALSGVVTEVEALGGTVSSISGSGLQAIFGAPQAHEDDPERAVRAAFRAVSARDGDRREGSPVLRFGIETGMAVVGPFAAGTSSEYSAVGAVVGAAAALQSAAKPGSILVGPATRAATQGLFDWGATEEVISLWGTEPLSGSYLESPRARARGRQLRLGGRSPLVGRGRELALVRTALRDLEAGRGSVVVVVGEPGLGKTRLLEECRKNFMAWVGARSGRLPLWLEGRCASYASTTPYGLYQDLLASWAGVALDQSEPSVSAALKRAVSAVMGDHNLFPVLARVMGVEAGGTTLQMRPQELQQATFAAFRSIVSRFMTAGPAVLALEDLHWADPTSLMLTDELCSLASDGALLVVLTRRPDPDPGVSGLQASLRDKGVLRVYELEIAPLAPEAERDLAAALLGWAAGEDVIDALRSGVAGNPFFLEERFFSLLETRALVRQQAHWSLGAPVGAAVPEALERLVRSRLDRLSPAAHEALCAASVLGPEVSRSLLAAVWDGGDQLVPALEELCQAAMLQEAVSTAELTFRFRHALIQEATYQGMPRAERRRAHGRAAWAIETASADRLEEVAGVLARHFAAADQPDRAVLYFQMAGDHALRVFANDEAIGSFRRGLDIATEASGRAPEMALDALVLRGRLVEVLWRTGQRAGCRELLRDAIDAAGTAGAHQRARLALLLGQMEIDEQHFEAAAAAYDAAEKLLGDGPLDQGRATSDLWLEIMVAGRAQLYLHLMKPDLVGAVLSAARPVLEANGSASQRHIFYRYLAWQRAIERRWDIDEQVIESARLSAAAAQEAGQGADIYREKGPAIAWEALFLGCYLLLHGDLDEAEERLMGSLSLADRSGDLILRANCLANLAALALRRHDKDAVRSLAPLAVGATEVVRFEGELGKAKACLAWLAWQDGRSEDVVVLANEAGELLSRGPSRAHKWLYIWPLVAVRLQEGKVAEAVTAARELLELSQKRLPDELHSIIESACLSGGRGEADVARGSLALALERAHELRFF